MKNIYFTADTHIGHEFIIKACNRPFDSVIEMNETIISNWNSKVKPNDTIYHLGDFSYRCKNPYEYFARLNGRKILVKGNHDKKDVLKLPWEAIHKVVDDLFIDNILLYLCHYSHRVWHNSCHGSYHLFGHSHGKLLPYGFSFDVGVDAWGFKPVSWDEIKQKMATLSIENHSEAHLLSDDQNSNKTSTTD
jgi:calcineurin-like phosphoesterase family protein